MSTMLCTTQHITTIIAISRAINGFCSIRDQSEHDDQQTGWNLAMENAREFNRNYPNRAISLPIEFALDLPLYRGILAETRTPLDVVKALKLCQALRYNSKETERLDIIISGLITNLPNYERLPWSI